MKNINWNELTPACYAIANANDVDVGVGGSMVHNNIRHGRAVDIGAENLPAAFRPDWAALGDGVDLAAENDDLTPGSESARVTSRPWPPCGMQRTIRA